MGEQKDGDAFTASDAALRASDARFRELADNISQFVWTVEESGGIYWYNKRWLEYTGTTLGEMRGRGWQNVIHPDHVDRVVERVRRSFETGTAWEDTFPLRGRDGRYRWFLSRALPIRDDSGHVIRWFGTNTDITEQIEAERALQELNENLEQRVEAATRERLHVWNVTEDVLVVRDLEGRFLSVNPAWTTVLGWAESEVLGRTSEWLLHPDDCETVRAAIASLRDTEKTRRFDVRLRHTDGSYRRLSWTAVRDRDRIYSVARDVTDLKQAEEQLDEARRQLAEVTRRTTLAAMTASIAHEINQPLGAIVMSGSASLRILSSADPDLELVRGALKRIVDDGQRASSILANIRSMLRGDPQHERRGLNVNDLLRDVLALVRSELERHRIDVQLTLCTDLPVIVGERVPLQQVLLNLIVNAIEAMSPVSDRARQLSVTTAPAGPAGVRIAVTDNGIGIDPQHIDRLFDAFYTTKPHGMGMGLSICQSIVESHGGRLSAAPGLDHGATFELYLPFED